MQEKKLRAGFEASLPDRLKRLLRVKLQPLIPAHWFAAAASECAGMYVAGYFYGAISVAQAYIEALSRFLAEHHHLRVPKGAEERCRRLHRERILSAQALDAAVAIFGGRDDFHHLNKQVPQEYRQLEARALECMNYLHAIESEVFAYSIGDEPGKVTLGRPEYWPSAGPGLVQVNLRQL